MRPFLLRFDHYRYQDGKQIRHKAGTTIQVSESEYTQLSNAVRSFREADREEAKRTPGTLEWKKAKQ